MVDRDYSPLPTDGEFSLALCLCLSARGCAVLSLLLAGSPLLWLLLGTLDILGASLPVEEATLFHRATSLHTAMVLMREENIANAVWAADWAREVGDVLGNGMLAADRSGIDAVAFARLAHGIVAAVEVLALFEMLGEVVATAGELSIQTEKPLLLGGERLRRRIRLASNEYPLRFEQSLPL